MGLTKNVLLLEQLQNAICFVGIGVCIYGLFVELSIDADASYRPLCDVSPHVSCSKALATKWGRGLGLIGPVLGDEHILNQRNPIYGMAIYVTLFCLGWRRTAGSARLYTWLVVLSNVVGAYLAVVLVMLRTLCLVCVAMYAVNIALLPLAIWRQRTLVDVRRRKKT